MTGHRHVAATLGGHSGAPRARRPVRPLLTTGIALVGAATLLILQPGADPPTVAIPAPTQSAETSTWLGDSIPAMAGEVPGETLFDLPAPSYLGRGVLARSQGSQLHIRVPNQPEDPDEAALDAVYGPKTSTVESHLIHLPHGGGSGNGDGVIPGVDDWQDLLGSGANSLNPLDVTGIRGLIGGVSTLIGAGLDAALGCAGPECERVESGVLFGVGSDATDGVAPADLGLFVQPDPGLSSGFDWGAGSQDDAATAGTFSGDSAGAPAAPQPETGTGMSAPSMVADPLSPDDSGTPAGPQAPVGNENLETATASEPPATPENPTLDESDSAGGELELDDESVGPVDRTGDPPADGSAENNPDPGAGAGVTSDPGGPTADSTADDGQRQAPSAGQDSGSTDSPDDGHE